MNNKIKYESIEEFIKKHLRYKQHWNTKLIDMSKAEWQELVEDTWIGGVAFKASSQFKVFETSNFGWIVFHPTSQTVDGSTPGRRIFKY